MQTLTSNNWTLIQNHCRALYDNEVAAFHRKLEHRHRDGHVQAPAKPPKRAKRAKRRDRARKR